MAQPPDIDQHILELDALHVRLEVVETQLAKARVQRLAGPASGLLFTGLALFWFGGEIRSATPGSPEFLWVMLFGMACSLGLVFNEVQVRRTILRLRAERDRLELALKAGGALITHLPAS